MSKLHGHNSCDYGREEYCPAVASDPKGPVVALAELIDGLLIENTELATAEAKVSSTDREYTCERRFSLFEATQDGLPGVVTETTVDMTYEADRSLGRHRYTVAASWLVASLLEGKIAGPLITKYHIETYDNGPTYGFVTETELLVEKGPYAIKERSITEYDYAELANQLAAIYNLSNGPWQDNKQLL